MGDLSLSVAVKARTVNISSITVSSGVSTVTTSTAHGLYQSGGAGVLAGVSVQIENSSTTANNGVWTVYTVPSTTTFTIASSLTAQSASGTSSMYLELNDKTTYMVADGSFEAQAVQHRRKTASSPFLEGETVVSSLRGNITEQLNVYARGKSQYACRVAVRNLQTVLEQPSFDVTRTVDDWRTLWHCYASDYTMQASKPLMHAEMVLMQIQLIREPAEQMWQV